MAAAQAIQPIDGNHPQRLRALLYLMLAIVMICTVLFGIPVESN